MSSFDSYVGGGEDLATGSIDDSASSRPFDSDGYMGYDPRLPSQRFESFRMSDQFPDELEKDSEDEYKASGNAYDHLADSVPPAYQSPFDDESVAHSPELFGQSFESSHPPDFVAADAFVQAAAPNGESFGRGHIDELFGFSSEPLGQSSNGAVLPPPEEMQPEEGFILREWRRKNAIYLEEKERKEKERLLQIVDESGVFKDEFYAKRTVHCETSRKNNRDKEKVFLVTREEFHANANKHYWKAIAELIPNELPSMELKSRGNKDKDKKKPVTVINHGPKPGKATDLSRMRQILLRLKHNPPAHMKTPPTPPPATSTAAATTLPPGAPIPATSSQLPASAPAPAPAPALAPASVASQAVAAA